MDLKNIMAKNDLTVPTTTQEHEAIRQAIATQVVDEDWKPDWAQIEADYLSEKISCSKLAARYAEALLPAIRARVLALQDAMREADQSLAFSDLQTDENIAWQKKRVVDIMADRITRQQGKGEWTTKRAARKMRVASAIVEERIGNDIEKIKAMREVERLDIERMRSATMKLLDEVDCGTDKGQQFLFKSDEQQSRADGLEAVTRNYEKIQKMLYRSWDIAEKIEQLNRNLNADLSEIPDEVLAKNAEEAANAG